MKAIVMIPAGEINEARKTQFETVEPRILERVNNQEVTLQGDYQDIDWDQEYLIEHIRPNARWNQKVPLSTKIYLKGKYLQKV